MAKPSKDQKKQKKIVQQAPRSAGNAWLWPLLLVVITWIVYSGSFNNKLTTWDDKNYINENPYIRSTKNDSLKNLFHMNAKDGGFIMGNYHPLPMLTYALEYKKAYKPGPQPVIEPRIFHVTNFIFHLLNTLLVYLFILLLARNRIVAFITALLFAIHPMHVESVAWVAERKDVMFTFFYLAALCAYVKYIKAAPAAEGVRTGLWDQASAVTSREGKGGIKWYVFALVLFLLSLLSKGMAVTLPVVMLLVDYLVARKLSWKLVLEKIPFFALSLMFGLIAVEAQKSAGAIGNFVTYSIGERIVLSFYGISLYLAKAVVPYNLTCFYSYPLKDINGALPAWLYMFPFVFAGLVTLVLFFRKHRVVVFGSVFFLVTIALVLQILPVGGAIIAERYTYIPYIGLFFMLAVAVARMMEWKPVSTWKPGAVIVIALLAILFSCLSFNRIKVWKDSITLWSDAISKDSIAPVAFNGRGDAYTIEKKYDLAITDLKRAIKLQEKYPEAHYNLGLAYYYKGMNNEAIAEYTLAIEIKPDLAVAYFNRSGTYYTIGKFQPALDDALKARELGYNVDPLYIDALKHGLNTLQKPAGQ